MSTGQEFFSSMRGNMASWREARKSRGTEPSRRWLRLEALEERCLLAADLEVVKDIDPTPLSSGSHEHFVDVDGTLFFVASTPATGEEL